MTVLPHSRDLTKRQEVKTDNACFLLHRVLSNKLKIIQVQNTNLSNADQ